MTEVLHLQAHTDLGPAIKARRLTRSIKQEQLADVVDISRYTLSDLEGGKSDPRLSTVLKLAHALGLKLVLLPREQEVIGNANAMDTQPSAPELDFDSVDDLEGAWKGE
jgi:transcriptional regulator with XRE-family HTH domain